MSESSSVVVGVQKQGSSPTYLKEMAIRAKCRVTGDAVLNVAADIGGGSGELTKLLAPMCKTVILVDYSPPLPTTLPENVQIVAADLNATWPLANGAVDFVFSVECIEHVENPRHFMREMARVCCPGGYLFVSTPNNDSLSSKITFLLRGQHRFFQEASYPAHITAILACDFERIGREIGLRLAGTFYSNRDTIPRVRWRLSFRGKWFSDCVGVLFQKPL